MKPLHNKETWDDVIRHWTVMSKYGVNELKLFVDSFSNVERPTRNHCALCNCYNDTKIPFNHQCKGCPIAKFTGRRYCVKTPHVKVSDLYGQYRYCSVEITDKDVKKWQTSCKEMLNFLNNVRLVDAENDK